MNQSRILRLIAVAALTGYASAQAPPSAPATSSQRQVAKELESLRKDIDAMRAEQAALKKDIQIIKDILMGKEPPLDNVSIDIFGAPTLGDRMAAVTVVEFSDYQCPFCGEFANNTFPALVSDYVNKNKVRFVFKNFPLDPVHPLAEKAAEAAECAGEQGRFWEMHARLFKSPQTLELKQLSGLAAAVGLKIDTFNECLREGARTLKVKTDILTGASLGVQATPTFFFGYADRLDASKIKAVKLLKGAQPIQAFSEILDAMLQSPSK